MYADWLVSNRVSLRFGCIVGDVTIEMDRFCRYVVHVSNGKNGPFFIEDYQFVYMDSILYCNVYHV